MNDDQILAAPAYVELAIDDIAEIARIQPTVAVAHHCGFRLSEVTQGNARAAGGNLSDATFGQRSPGFIDDPQLMSGEGVSAADKFDSAYPGVLFGGYCFPEAQR